MSAAHSLPPERILPANDTRSLSALLDLLTHVRTIACPSSDRPLDLRAATAARWRVLMRGCAR